MNNNALLYRKPLKLTITICIKFDTHHQKHGSLMTPTIDGSEIRRKPTWDGAKTPVNHGKKYLFLNW